MSSVTFPVELGGDGSTVTDDDSPVTGLAEGGHRERFVPALFQTVKMAESAKDSAVGAARAKDDSEEAKQLAQRWASDTTDPIEGGQLSAKAYALGAASEREGAEAARDDAEGFRDQAQVYATQQLKATSATNLVPGAGNKTFTIQTNKAFVVGQYLIATSAGAPANSMSGGVVSYDPGTGELVLSVDTVAGNTARSDWVIGIAAKGSNGSSPTGGPSNVTLYRVGDVLDSIAFVQDGQNGSIYLTYASGRLTQVVTTYGGKTRTETLNYTGDDLTSITATET